MKKLLFLIFPILLLLLPFTSEVQSIYYGQPEFGYPYVGYITVQRSDGKVGFCGVNYYSETLGITAAHCISDFAYDSIYAFTGPFSYSSKDRITVTKGISHPGYDENLTRVNAGIHDFAVLQLDDNPSLTQFSEIATPDIGCDYYLLGYGGNEDDEKYDRRGSDICITAVERERFELGTTGAHFCSGDSGSGIYEKGTNNLVGIVSTFGHDFDCTLADVFYATRVDTHKDFISQYVTEPSGEDTEEKTTTLTTTAPENGVNIQLSNSDIFFLVFITFFCLGSMLFAMMLIVIVYTILTQPKKTQQPIAPIGPPVYPPLT